MFSLYLVSVNEDLAGHLKSAVRKEYNIELRASS